MTEAEAIALAAKRERHKSKHMTHVRWAAVHDSVKGWHAALVPVDHARATPADVERLAIIGAAVKVFGVGPTVAALRMIAAERDKCLSCNYGDCDVHSQK